MELLTNLDPRRFAELRGRFDPGVALARVFSLVEAADCRTVVIEEDPEEQEYKAELQAFYSKVFSQSQADRPKRLHFFEDVINRIEDIKDQDSRYLGYCDVRPTPGNTISGALIDTRVFVKSNRDYLFLICQRDFSVRFDAERSLHVRAFPYMQQDGNVVRCAQAALASIARFHDKTQTGPEFTTIGSRIPTGARAIPSGGLEARQIGLAISEMNFEPVLYDFSFTPAEAKEVLHCEQIIYRYVESGIPVLIGVEAGRELHALVVIGHTFTPDSWLAHTRTSYYNRPKTGWTYHCSTNWVERFVVQDDNLGPYMLAPADFIQYFACRLVIVPLSPNIYLLPEDAESYVGDFLCPKIHDGCKALDQFLDKHAKEGKAQDADSGFWYREFRRHVDSGDLVLRTNLRDSADWRKTVEESECYEDFKTVLESLPLPERIWVVEISWPNIFTHSRKFGGEMLLDPTSPVLPGVETFKQGWLWLHVPGIIAHRNAKTNDIGICILEGRDPVRSHHRTVGRP